MYCVIQEIEYKKQPYARTSKKLEVSATARTTNGEIEKIRYWYWHSDERFERPIRKAYKISIHKSYRENGKVKKKQWAICTIGYYDLIDFGAYDFIVTRKLEEKLKEMEITEEALVDIVYLKLDPIIEQVNREYESTEEYKVEQKHKKILSKYRKNKQDFEQIYGQETYDYCYDIFGVLRNEEYLNKIKEDYKTQQEYTRSYYEKFKSNYNHNSYSGYYDNTSSNYTDEEKKNLKKIYKALAVKFHPDVNKEGEEVMKLVNKLKDQWGI